MASFINRISRLLLFPLCTFLVYNCGGPISSAYIAESGESSATGWAIDGTDPATGFKANTRVVEKYIPPGLVFILGGSFTKGSAQENLLGRRDNSLNNLHVTSFYMDRTEVTNLMYSEYLNWIVKVFPPSERKYAKIYNSLLPDTMAWADGLALMDHLVRNYLRHPSYQLYPVVGVSWLQANMFCEWRTNRVNEKILKDYGYLSPDSSYGNFNLEVYLSGGYNKKKEDDGDFDEFSDEEFSDNKKKKKSKEDDPFLAFSNKRRPPLQTIITEKYRLPTETEWEYAATYSLEGDKAGNSREMHLFLWDEFGKPLANFRQSAAVFGRNEGDLGDGYDLTAPVMSYPPNDAGLYDMIGNVSEWTMDVYRPQFGHNTKLNYFRGNVFKRNVQKKSGVLALHKRAKYETLENGKVMVTALPGDPVKKELSYKDVKNHPRINSAYAVNQGDGDLASSRDYMKFTNDLEENKRASTQVVYNHPQAEVVKEDGKTSVIPDSKFRTTRISDKTRVYKGGSWEDLTYWQDPTQRRFLHQEKSSRNIGFRCAMSLLGEGVHLANDRYHFFLRKNRKFKRKVSGSNY